MPTEQAARYKRPESVLVVVHTADGLVLQLERRDVEGFWQSVTGSLEHDESTVAAARRELFEETGIDAGAAAHALRDHDVSTRFAIRAPWRARYAPGVTENVEHRFSLAVPAICEVRLEPGEHRRYRWLPAHEALALASSPTDRSAIESLIVSECFTVARA